MLEPARDPGYAKHYMTQKDIDRFYSQFEVGDPDKCWMWQGNCDKRGYPLFYIKRLPGDRNASSWKHNAHAIAYELSIEGPLMGRVSVCPENKACMNPAHLKPLPYAALVITPEEKPKIDQYRADVEAWLSHHYRVKERRLARAQSRSVSRV